MKINIPDKHLTISNILMFLTLFSVAGGAIGVMFQQIVMLAITVACLAAFALAIYALWQVITHNSGVIVHYKEPVDYAHPQHIEHVHYHYHKLMPKPVPAMIEQQPTLYTVLPQPQRQVLLPVDRKRIEVKR